MKKITHTFDVSSKITAFTQITIHNEIREMITVTGLLFNLNENVIAEKDGNPLRLKKVLLKVNTNTVPIIFYQLADEINNKLCCSMTYMRVSVYMDEKPTANTVITSRDSESFHYTEDDIHTNDELISTVLSVDLKSFGKEIYCRKCKSTLIPEDDLVVW